MQARLGVAVELENDANVGALGEKVFGAARGVDDLIYVRVSAGIGAGLILGGRPYRGFGGVAGEIGHVLADPAGPICRCGNRGCLETIASPPAVAALLERSSGEPVGVERLLELVAAKDRRARRAVADAGEAVGRALSMLVNVLNPSSSWWAATWRPAGPVLLDPIGRPSSATAWRPPRARCASWPARWATAPRSSGRPGSSSPRRRRPGHARGERRPRERIRQDLRHGGTALIASCRGGRRRLGGLQACLKLARLPVEVTLIDRRNFHLFQPLAYQVATGAVSPAEICYPLRSIFRRRRNVRVVLGEVVDVDLAARRVALRDVALGTAPAALEYDTLIVSGGSEYSYFGHDEWQEHAAELKSLEGALSIRRRILEAFEAAELESDPEVRAALLTFVVVGAGPTGVEMAGQIAEIARDERGDFRTYDPGTARILIVEALDRILTSFPESLSAKALRALESLGVTGRIGESVIDVDAESVTVRRADDSTERIPTRTVIWAAGVNASPLARTLAERAGLEVDRAGRLEVLGDLSVEGHPEVLAIGDMVTVRQPDGTALVLPGVAPVAMQQGRHAARVLRERLAGREPKPFRYVDKGNLATIGRARAVADVKGLHLSGLLAWVAWLIVHLWYLIGFQNRVLVVIRWAFSFFSHGRGARLIAHD